VGRALRPPHRLAPRRAFELILLCLWSADAQEVEIMVLRHGLAVLRRQHSYACKVSQRPPREVTTNELTEAVGVVAQRLSKAIMQPPVQVRWRCVGGVPALVERA
jgi:hypothetical protein